MSIKELENKSRELKNKILDIAYSKGRAHLGGIFSILDILIVLKYNYPTINFLLGKGHASLGLYVILNDLKILSNDELSTYCEDNSMLGIQLFPGFYDNKIITGSLGNVIGITTGISIANKLNSKEKVECCIIGDGECEEGSIWESVDFIVKNKIKNILVIVDKNTLSVTRDIDNNRLLEKFQGFGINCLEINGHNYKEIISSIEFVKETGISTILLCNTIKGKGVSFMEDNISWHHGILTKELYLIAKNDILNGFT